MFPNTNRWKQQTDERAFLKAWLKNCVISKVLRGSWDVYLPFSTDKSQTVHILDIQVSNTSLSFRIIKAKNKILSLVIWQVTCVEKLWHFPWFILRRLKKRDEITMPAYPPMVLLHHTIIRYHRQSRVREKFWPQYVIFYYRWL